MGKKLIIKGADFSTNGFRGVRYRKYIANALLSDIAMADKLDEYLLENQKTIVVDNAEVQATMANANNFYTTGYYKQLYIPLHQAAIFDENDNDFNLYKVVFEGRITGSGYNNTHIFGGYNTAQSRRRTTLSKIYTSGKNGLKAQYRQSVQSNLNWENLSENNAFDFTATFDPAAPTATEGVTAPAVTVNGTTLNPTDNETCAQTFWCLFNLFGPYPSNNGASAEASFRANLGGVAISKVSVYRNDSLLTAFKPCLDDDNVACMYDTGGRSYVYPAFRTIRDNGDNTYTKVGHNNIKFGFTAYNPE